MSSISLEQIKELIPHRDPILLVDRVEDVVEGESATGIKLVTPNEPVLAGHFPNHPVYPGVYIVEAMAQTCAILVAYSVAEAKGKIVYFTSIEEAKFRKPVLPNDTLNIKVKKLQNRKSLWKFECAAYVGETLVTEAKISAMIML
ncbi:MAG: 3-hydroxyacyl-ACP dehydratase FabZ [Rickettsiales bacterium]|nr:3-hydroxyacyl-ACP dehydratase FabZ [Rickettsiales bacterium]